MTMKIEEDRIIVDIAVCPMITQTGDIKNRLIQIVWHREGLIQVVRDGEVLRTEERPADWPLWEFALYCKRYAQIFNVN